MVSRLTLVRIMFIFHTTFTAFAFALVDGIKRWNFVESALLTSIAQNRYIDSTGVATQCAFHRFSNELDTGDPKPSGED